MIWLLLLQPAAAFAQKPQAQAVCAIAFYNTENLFDPADDPDKDDDDFTPNGSYRYTNEIYKKKLRNIGFAISRIAKDVTPEGVALIGLAEIENSRVLADLIVQPELKSKGYKYISYKGPDPRGIDVALLYDPKVFRVIKSAPLRINLKQKALRDVLYVNGILYKDTVHLLVNHWPSRREGQQETEWERKAAAGVNRVFIDSLLRRSANAKIIVMGDFNDDPHDASLTQTLHATNSKAVKPTELYNPWLDIHRSGKGTLMYKRQWNLFDQILCSPSLMQQGRGLKYKSAAIFDRDFLILQTGKYRGSPYRSYRGTYWTNGYSDHLPVVMYLSRN